MNDLSINKVGEAFGPKFLDADYCREWILHELHSEDPVCPFCGHRIVTREPGRFWENKICFCGICKKKFNAKTGTILTGLNLKFEEIILILFLIDFGLGNPQIASITGRRRDSVRALRYKFDALQKITNGKR